MKKIIRVLLFSCLIANYAIHADFEKYVRGSEGWGFYAEFLWVINHIKYCITHDRTPVIYWGPSFAYYDPAGYNGSANCWEYYFEPVSPLSYHNDDVIALQHWYEDFSVIWQYNQYIDNLNLIEADSQNQFLHVTTGYFPRGERYPVGPHLYSESFRRYVKESIIDKYVHPKRIVNEAVADFYKKNIEGKRTIAIHLRGRFLWNEVPYVPTLTIFDEANKYADGNTQFFIATDQLPLLEEAKRVLKGTVVFFESERFNVSTAPVAGQNKIHPALGENVVIEMLLLSLCDHLIHTISNVSTTALYFNPNLKHTVLY